MRRKLINERGGATANFIIVLLIAILLVYGGWNYIGAVYQSQGIKQEMQTAVLQGSALPSGKQPIDFIKSRIQKALTDYEVPLEGTTIEVKQTGNVFQARVTYKRKVNLLPFGFWEYEYTFDETAAPVGFLTKP